MLSILWSHAGAERGETADGRLSAKPRNELQLGEWNWEKEWNSYRESAHRDDWIGLGVLTL